MDKIFITNDIKLAQYAQESGIERIMVDLEVIGKEERQGHLNTVFSKHTFEDIENMKKVLSKSKLLVRINPIHNDSKEEIDKVISLGADIIMLPMFTTAEEVKKFIDYISKRATVCLLLETTQSLVRIDEILEVKGIDEIHVGLNDLHLAMNLDFMFELLSGGIVEYLSKKIISKNIKFGFGGVARVGQGMIDATLILSEHIRLNSSMVILSRDFKNYKESYEDIRDTIDLENEICKINDFIDNFNETDFEKNKNQLKEKVAIIVSKIRDKKSYVL
ncbi:HpcH/HpaI aldolase/citrate lyase family protein [Aliarcobacter cryaerophilus]|uniref:HpcH/HpaI aldolase/citrate lyase family protein n=1 Tax=Aliarcobacter cryaerophilus TaxID=28198 RepID=UPI0021B53F05|nr:HpcH/HpaI aldolase/citrate lyase family protein [Aliarcobacter cryaerophilus]